MRTGIILSGGKSSRMGTEKGMVLLKGKTFIEHIIAVLKPKVDAIIIVSNNPIYEQFGNICVRDRIPNAGPLAGLEAGLAASKTKKNIVLSCDVPFIAGKIIDFLIQKELEFPESDIIQLKCQGSVLPLLAIYDKNCASICVRMLKIGERRLQQLTKNVPTKTIEIPIEWECLVRNINTKEALNENKN